jgi:hypothetical protein
MIQQPGMRLKKELVGTGLEGAVSGCRDIASTIAGELSRRSGGRVARVRLNTCNRLLGDPDVWERQILADFDRNAAAGEKIESMEYSETIDEPRGRYLRYMKALPVQPLCLTCHGTAENIPQQVKAKLAVGNPHDRATGYVLGQVRGAVAIKLPVGTAQ